jgi:hypothetical protein
MDRLGEESARAEANANRQNILENLDMYEYGVYEMALLSPSDSNLGTVK